MADAVVDNLLHLPLSVRYSCDGGAFVVPQCAGTRLPEFTQELLVHAPKPSQHLQQLQRELLEPNLDTLLGDVSLCGHQLRSTTTQFRVLPECSAPTCIVEPTLPFGAAAQSGRECGWTQTHFTPATIDQLTAKGLWHKPLSRHTAQEEGWRGFATSTPYLPGATGTPATDAVNAVLDVINKPAAQEAQSGLWLRQIQTGSLPQVCAPGLPQGAFGAWCEDVSVVCAQQEELRQSLAEQQQGAGVPPAPVGPTPTSAGAAGGGGAVLPVSFRVAQAAELRSVFDDVWILGLEAAPEEEEEEEEEGSETEAEEQEGAASVAVPGVARPELLSALGTQGTAGDTQDTVDSILTAADHLVTLSARAASQAVGQGAESRPLLGAAPVLGSCNTEWAVRGGVDNLDTAWAMLKPNLAIQYPFELDTFQKEAVVHMERGDSVFVAAHTSAGKTVVAEYAFALATKHCTRAIYTSPIKTISNQKFRDLSAKFDVGLLTGDVQLKPTSPCLILTTEILRSMLYRGADLIRDVEWVVFDEVHYVNDADRGVVWEEVIIMLPPHIGIVMLSATVPNLMDFADWVGRTKRRVMYVTATLKRPVPLQHTLYYSGELYPVCSRDQWLTEGFRSANMAYKNKNQPADTRKPGEGGRGAGPGGRGPAAGAPGFGGRGGQSGGARGGGGRGAGGGGAGRANQVAAGAMRGLSGGSGPNSGAAGGRAGERQQMLELIQLLKKQTMLPVAVFCFSKKRCDSAASALGSLDLTTSTEKHTAHVFLEKVLARLKEGDRVLPQILTLRELIRRGLAVHHAGLLPVMKEAVEMLFCQGYIKVLFCTETFAMGVNAPTRTVVFHSLRKHDGKEFRYLLPGEYTQMAGRAGRRGLDTLGHVIIACWDDVPEEGLLRGLVVGRGVALGSQFRLTWSMIANMLRVEDLKVEDMLKRSFAEWQAQRAAPKAASALTAVTAALDQLMTLPWPHCAAGCTREEVSEYHALTQQIDDLSTKVQEALVTNPKVKEALQPGRCVLWRNPVNGLTQPAVLLGDTPDSCRMLPNTAASAGRTPLAGALGGGSQLGLKALGAAGANTGSGTSGGGGGRRVVLLSLHTPGSVDNRHLTELRKQREATASSAPPLVQKQQDEFAGMVMVGKRGGDLGGGFGRSSSTAALGNGPGPLPYYGALGGEHYVLADAALSEITDVGRNKVKVTPSDILSGDWGSPQTTAPSNRVQQALGDALRALRQECGGTAAAATGGLPVLDLRGELRMTDLEVSSALERRNQLLSQRATLPVSRCTELGEQYALVRAEARLRAQQEKLKHELSDASLSALPEFEVRVGIMQELGYLDASRSVTLKGRVLCEINSTQNELIASELVFSGVLEGLSPAEAIALISALVFQEKSEVEPELTPALALARAQLVELAQHTAQVCLSHGLQIDPDEMVAEALHPGLMQVVYEWAAGTPFADICGLTDVMEGSIVRAIVRLDQAARELQDAARVMGNTSLFSQMQAASAAIKRDVIFAASLYVA